jgi:uncharacterized RDD family membrane protein YckC
VAAAAYKKATAATFCYLYFLTVKYMAQTYLMVVNGKPQGPFSIDQLKEFNIKPGDFVKATGMNDFKEAHEVAELRELLGFSKQALIPQYFGSFDQRLMADALDWFFVCGAFIILVFIIFLFVSDKGKMLVIALGLAAIIPVVKFIYHIVMESSPKQGTYGKQILKIKVCNMQGERISVAHATGRNLAKILSVFSLFIGYLLCFFTKQQQSLHDMVADTLVMKDRLF